MGRWPLRTNENRLSRRPRESGGPLFVRDTMDSRLRGNDESRRDSSLRPE